MNRPESESDLILDYRLPLTFIRVVGARHELHDAASGTDSVSCDATVTTEIGPDLRSLQKMLITPEELSHQKATWTFTADGRLLGSNVTNEADRAAGWKAAISAGAAVAGIAGPTLLGAGPPGWIALAAATGLAAGAAALASGAGQPITQLSVMDTEEIVELLHEDATKATPRGKPDLPEPPNPADWDIAKLYETEHEGDAQTLAKYRAALAAGTQSHANAVHSASSEALNHHWYDLMGVVQLERLMASIEAGAARAERKYEAWQQSKRTVTNFEFDHRLKVDELPKESEILEWARKPSSDTTWGWLAQKLHTAVSVDLVEDPAKGEPTQPSRPVNDVFSSSREIMFRQPRPAILRVWKLHRSGANRFRAEQVELRRIQVNCPGNEQTLDISSPVDSTRAVDVTFDDNGALTKMATDLSDAALTRANAVSGLITAASTGVTAGADLRKALAPPTLAERAAEHKAAKELGLVPTDPDPLDPVRKQLEETQLRAQLKIADQIAQSTSPPVIIQFTVPTSSSGA